MGHVHRSGFTQGRTIDGWVYGWEVPCLCSLEPEYCTGPGWSLGIGRFRFDPKKPIFFENVNFMPDYSCVVGKKQFWLN
jgi:hypothetical protein